MLGHHGCNAFKFIYHYFRMLSVEAEASRVERGVSTILTQGVSIYTNIHNYVSIGSSRVRTSRSIEFVLMDEGGKV